jgi:hypothetical protein
MAKCHVTGCGLPRHVCPTAASSALVAFADAASHHSGCSTNRSRTSARPPSPVVCELEGETVVHCQPRREFDVIALPFARVVRVTDGQESSLDDRVTENFLRELHDKDEQARRKAALTPEPVPRVLKPRKSNSGLTCAAKLGAQHQVDSENVAVTRHVPRPKTSSSAGAIRPLSGPSLAVRKSGGSVVSRPTSGNTRKPPLYVSTTEGRPASSHHVLSVSPCDTHCEPATCKSSTSTVDVGAREADVWAAPVRLDPIALSRCAAIAHRKGPVARNNWTVEPPEATVSAPAVSLASQPVNEVPKLSQPVPSRVQSASGIRRHGPTHVRSRTVNAFVAPSNQVCTPSAPAGLFGMIKLDDSIVDDEPVVGAISRVLRARRAKGPLVGKTQSISASISAAASPSKQVQPSVLSGFMKGLSVVKSR